jgi:hypothetical protein
MGKTRVVMSPQGRVELAVLVEAKAVRPLTQAVAMDMHRMVPVLSGDLQDTISVDFPAPLVGRVWFGDVDTGVDYHLYVEYGTSLMDAQPFARPALYKIRSL